MRGAIRRAPAQRVGAEGRSRGAGATRTDCLGALPEAFSPQQRDESPERVRDVLVTSVVIDANSDEMRLELQHLSINDKLAPSLRGRSSYCNGMLYCSGSQEVQPSLWRVLVCVIMSVPQRDPSFGVAKMMQRRLRTQSTAVRFSSLSRRPSLSGDARHNSKKHQAQLRRGRIRMASARSVRGCVRAPAKIFFFRSQPVAKARNLNLRAGYGLWHSLRSPSR